MSKSEKEELRKLEAEEKLARQKEYSRRQKGFSKVIGENFATWSLLMIIALMIMFIWTDIGIFTSWTSFIGDALVTAVLYILADIICASYIGAKGGKLDDEYIRNHDEYLSIRERVRSAGMTLLGVFCAWQIDLELELYIRKKCKELKIDYTEYIERYHNKTLEELSAMFPKEKTEDERVSLKDKIFGGVRKAKTSSKAARIFALNQIKPIELTPDILMTDGKVKNERGDVGESGEEHIERHTTGWKHILLTVIFVVVAVSPTFALAQNFSWGMLIYTTFKIALLLFRMFRGYSRGAKAFNTIEPKHLQAKTKYLYMYLEFLENKTYLKLGDKYGSNMAIEETVLGESVGEAKDEKTKALKELHVPLSDG